MGHAPPDPAEGQSAAVQAGFARLRAQFVHGLPARWQEIDNAPTALLRQAALHRLAGAAGSYGLLALGAAARRAEQLCMADDAAAAQAALAAVSQALQDAGVTLP